MQCTNATNATTALRSVCVCVCVCVWGIQMLPSLPGNAAENVEADRLCIVSSAPLLHQ